MRLEFQVMCFLIIFSSIAYESHASTYALPRNQRNKRLIPYECGEPGDVQEGREDRHMMRNSSSRPANSKSRSTGIAVKAAQEAKQANDDMASAVKVASDRIKLEYAEKAATAAKAAEAVLSAKLQVLQQLEMEVREAEIVVQEESQELFSAEANSQLALKAHQQARDEQKLLQSCLKVVRENYATAEQVSAACQQSMADKTTLMETAQQRVALLIRQLNEARSDYAKTKKAAYRALCAANEAKERIQHSEG